MTAYHTQLAVFTVQDVNQTTVETYTITSTAYINDNVPAGGDYMTRYFYVSHYGRRGIHVTDHTTYSEALKFVLIQTGWGEATINIPSEES